MRRRLDLEKQRRRDRGLSYIIGVSTGFPTQGPLSEKEQGQ